MKILVVLTSHDQLGDTGEKTGFWLEELAAPYYAFLDAGAQLTLASPKGGLPPLEHQTGAAVEKNRGQSRTVRAEGCVGTARQCAGCLRTDISGKDYRQTDFAAGRRCNHRFYAGGMRPCAAGRGSQRRGLRHFGQNKGIHGHCQVKNP